MRTTDEELAQGWHDFSAFLRKSDEDIEFVAAMTLLGRFHEDNSYESSTEVQDAISFRLMLGDTPEQIRKFLIELAQGKTSLDVAEPELV